MSGIVKSMTGYGYREMTRGTVQVAVEIKSYNNRYLDLYVYLPPHLGPLEPQVREFMSQRVQRGRVEVGIKIKDLEEKLEISVDRPAVLAYLKALREVAAVCGIEEEVRLAHLLRLEGVIRIDRTMDLQTHWEAVLPALEAASLDYEAQRIREGGATKDDILGQLDIIETKVLEIESLMPALEEYFRTTTRKRIEEIVNSPVDENRLLTEVAVLLVKASVNEEVVRIKSHLRGFREVVAGGGSVGKRLDFLCQEIHREVNTTGSKSVMVEVSERTVVIKDALENIREQLRNLE